LTYASQSLRMPPGTLREFGFVVGVAPGRPTGRGLMRCENDTWLFTAMGMAGHEPPNDLAGMCAFAEAFAPAHALAAVRAAQPMGEVARHRLASSQWRQYDKMRRFPDGLLVVGDAYQRFGGGLGAAAPPGLLPARTDGPVAGFSHCAGLLWGGYSDDDLPDAPPRHRR
jgi:hypothetical protein